ncbi:MAG TPA: cupin domain-containing protein [Synergistales bacterium]|nr:cupin domain-containing protein [Synergistales bacterium]
MKTFDMETVEKFTGRPGFIGKFIHSEGFTFAQWEIKKGTELVFHDHPHEQTTLLLAGKMELGTADNKVTLTPGQGIVFAGGEAHGGFALEDCLVIDVFCPVREDFKKLQQEQK